MQAQQTQLEDLAYVGFLFHEMICGRPLARQCCGRTPLEIVSPSTPSSTSSNIMWLPPCKVPDAPHLIVDARLGLDRLGQGPSPTQTPPHIEHTPITEKPTRRRPTPHRFMGLKPSSSDKKGANFCRFTPSEKTYLESVFKDDHYPSPARRREIPSLLDNDQSRAASATTQHLKAWSPDPREQEIQEQEIQEQEIHDSRIPTHKYKRLIFHNLSFS